MTEHNSTPEKTNDPVILEGEQLATTEDTAPKTSKFQMPLLAFALVGLGLAGTHGWANRDAWKEVITGEATKSSSCTEYKGHCCRGGCKDKGVSFASTENTEKGTCPLTGGCPSSNVTVVNGTNPTGACCDKMKLALKAAMLESQNNKLKAAENKDNKEIVTAEISLPPSPALPENLN